MDFFLKFFFTQEVDFEFSKDDNEVPEYAHVPDIAEIADSLKSCFHVGLKIFRKDKKFLRILQRCSKRISSSMTSTSSLKSQHSSLRTTSSTNLWLSSSLSSKPLFLVHRRPFRPGSWSFPSSPQRTAQPLFVTVRPGRLILPREGEIGPADQQVRGRRSGVLRARGGWHPRSDRQDQEQKLAEGHFEVYPGSDCKWRVM